MSGTASKDVAWTEDSVVIRPASRDDMTIIHTMIHELATFEGVPDGPSLTVADLISDAFEATPAWFFALVAEVNGEVVGYALCNRAYSSWTRRALYVEDLYVRPQYRRHGLGRRLLHALAKEAVSCGAHRIDWHVLESNAGALGLYTALGARDLHLTEGRAALRLDHQHIRGLANDCYYKAKTNE